MMMIVIDLGRFPLNKIIPKIFLGIKAEAYVRIKKGPYGVQKILKRKSFGFVSSVEKLES